MAEEQNQQEQMMVNTDYKVWKKQAPYEYDFLLLHSCQWPSYTFQWLPQRDNHQDYQDHYALISSNASENEQSHIMKVKCSLPYDNKGNISIIEDKSQLYTQATAKKPRIQIVQKVAHPTQVNRARANPANSDVVACSSTTGDINLLTMKDGMVGRLAAHSSEGYGLSWNHINHSVLASGHTDRRICIWDVQKNKQSNQKISPIMEILYHNAPVQDVAWHKFHPSLFASCSDDRLIMIWDTRFRSAQSSSDRKPLFQIVAHTNQVYSLDFSPFNEFLFLSGSGDESISVWDTRNLTRSFQTHKAHSNRVIKVQWNPHSAAIFGSCANDRTVCIWDISRDKKQPDSCLLFEHRGHRSKVPDFDWSPHEKLIIGSVQQSNSLQVWEMSQATYYQQEEITKEVK